MLDKVVLIGYSGHAYVVIEAAQAGNIEIVGYCEHSPLKKNPFSLDYLGDESTSEFDWGLHRYYFVGIGDNVLRSKIGDRVKANGRELVSIVHPTATLSKTAQYGRGTFINANATINALATIGNHCVLNTGCILEHECSIGDGVHLAPGAVLAGNVCVDDLTFIGANAVVKQGVSIGKNVVVGAGAVIIKDVPDNYVVVGNPSKRVK